MKSNCIVQEMEAGVSADSPGCIRILLRGVESERKRLTATLRVAGVYASLSLSSTGKDFIARIKKDPPQVIIACGSLGRARWLGAIESARRLSPRTPCIVLCGSMNKKEVIEAFRMGATDCADPDDPEDIANTVIRAAGQASACDRFIGGTPMDAELMKVYLDVAGVIFVALDKNGIVTMINRKGAEILEHSIGDIVGKSWFNNFLPKRDRIAVKRVFREIIAGSLDQVEYNENSIVASSGEERTIAWHNALIRDESGRITGTISSGEDVTDQRISEKKLRESEIRYKELFNNMISGVALFRPIEKGGDFYIDRINSAGERILGITPNGAAGKKVTEIIPNFTEYGVLDQIRRVWLSGRPEFYPYIEYDDSREITRWVEYSLDRIPSGEVIAVFEDVTDQRHAQSCLERQQYELEQMNERLQLQIQKLADGEKKYRTLSENLPDIVQRFDADLRHLFVSTNVFEFTGKPADFYIGKTPSEVDNYRDECAVRERYLRSVFETGEPMEFEADMSGLGGIRHMNIRMMPEYDVGGTVKSVVAVMRDISDWKKAEEYRAFAVTILNILNSDIEKMDVISEILDNVKSFTGFDAVAIRLEEGEDYPYYATNGFRDEFIAAERSLFALGEEGSVVRNEGRVPVLECLCGAIIRGETNSELPFFTGNGSFWTNSTTDLLASPSYAGLHVKMRNRCNWEGYESVGLIPLRSDRRIVGLLQLCNGRCGMLDRGLIEFFEGVGASIGIALERKASEEMIRDSLREKETLLKEIHHRVKNNLQVISSLLYLQSEHVMDARVRESLVISQNRIRSMALVHEKLYRSSDLSEIDLNDYVQTLAGELSNSYMVADRIRFSLNVSDIYLNIDTAIPCALIINELITNAIKHAFPEGREGTVSVEFSDEGSGLYRMSVADDGVGFHNGPVGGDSLGMQLVNALVGQLNGTMVTGNGEGSRFDITFVR